MLPVVEDFVQRFNLEDFVIVADSGLMNNTNIALLESANYKYIIGARIKNETEKIRQWILSLDKTDGSFYGMKKGVSRLIIGYAEKRAKKDKYNREKGVKRLKAACKSGTITKENIMRPVFHFTQKRIEAHVCICFVAYKIYKELERILKISGINLSIDKVLNIAKTITAIKIKLPLSGETLTKTMLLMPKHKTIEPLFDKNFWKSF